MALVSGLIFVFMVIIAGLIALIVQYDRDMKKLVKDNSDLADALLKIHELSLIDLFSYSNIQDKETWLKEQLRKIKDIVFDTIVTRRN